MTISPVTNLDLLDEILKARNERDLYRKQVVALTNVIRSVLHHPRSGEKLRMMRECLDRVEFNLP